MRRRVGRTGRAVGRWSRSNGPRRPEFTAFDAGRARARPGRRAPAAAARPSSRRWPPAAPGGPHRRPRCGCAAPTCWTTTPRSPTPCAGRWTGRPASSPPRPRPPRPTSATSTPERLARLARTAGPPAPARPWTARRRCRPSWPTASRVGRGHGRVAAGHGARLVVACRAEYWESAGAEFPEELLYGSATGRPAGRAGRFRPASGSATSPPKRPGRPAPGTASRTAPSAAPTPGTPSRCACSPRCAPHLARRPGGAGRPGRRLRRPPGPHVPARRRPARPGRERPPRHRRTHGSPPRSPARSTRPPGAASGPGQGELDRAAFEAVFPWGQRRRGSAAAPAGPPPSSPRACWSPRAPATASPTRSSPTGSRASHLDLDEALHALVHRRAHRPRPRDAPPPGARTTASAPSSRPLLLLAAAATGPANSPCRLRGAGATPSTPTRTSWWAARLLPETLLRVPDALPYLGVLRLPRRPASRAWRRAAAPRRPSSGPRFWTALPAAGRRAARPAAPPGPRRRRPRPQRSGGRPGIWTPSPGSSPPTPGPYSRYLTRWFDDDRPLPATPHATVADRRPGAAAHPPPPRPRRPHRGARRQRATAGPTNCSPSSPRRSRPPLCRAVDRWAHDETARAARRRGGPRPAHRPPRPHRRRPRPAAPRRPRPAGPARRQPPARRRARRARAATRHSRDRHLPQALAHFAAGDPQLPPSALVPPWPPIPKPVLEAFRARLRGPDRRRGAARARRRHHARRSPAGSPPSYGRRSRDAPRPPGRGRRTSTGASTTAPPPAPYCCPWSPALLDGGTEPVRAALAGVLAAPGTPASPAAAPRAAGLPARPRTRARPSSDAVLHAGRPARPATGPTTDADLVHRTGLLLVRTPEGAARFDRGLVDLGRQLPGFAARLAGWLADAPQEWAARGGPRAPAARSRTCDGSLSPGPRARCTCRCGP